MADEEIRRSPTPIPTELESGPIALPDLGEAPTEERSPGEAAHARRISYFMLFRLAVLFAFTILAGITSWYRGTAGLDFYEGLTWTSLGLGYLVTLLFAWTLPRARNLERFAVGQTLIDIVLAAVVVQLSGGIESGFAFLYPVAILGAATMGDRRQTWAAAGACLIIYVTMGTLQVAEVILPMTSSGELLHLSITEAAFASARTLGGMAGVTVLSAYLNVQLSSSVQQVGSLRALNENIVRSLSSGLLTVDANGLVLFANPTGTELIAAGDELYGRNIDELLPGVRPHLEDSGNISTRFDLEFRRPDGRTLQLGLNCAPLLNAEGRFLGHLVHFQDVTELHRLAKKARRNERLAAVGGLAASVAHEVRNPLAAIAGSAELLQGAVSDEDDRRLLDVIRRESGRLERTVSDLLAFTRPNKPERVPLDLGRAIREIVQAFRTDPANQRVKIAFAASEALIAGVDPSQFSQILWNLMRNAVEAMDGDGNITITLRNEDAFAVVGVRDDGPGISPEHIEHIFEPFYSTKTSGSGFGLALIHRMVQDHGGEITASSRVGHGAKFTLRFPGRA